MFSALQKFGRLGAPAGRSLDAQIAALFPDVWYDPSDLTTLYQDAAGTTPVTAVEQPVGLMLDKSRGLVLGSELSAYASGFSSTSGISGIGATVSISGASLLVTATSSDGSDRAEIPISGLKVGARYLVTIVARQGSQVTQQTIRASTALNLTQTAITSTSAQTFTWRTDAIASSGAIRVYCADSTGSVGDNCFVDSISVRELPGYHAYHTPGDTTTRPTLSRRINLLTKTEDFADAVWAKTGGGTASAPSVTANSAVAPDGTLTADRVQLSLNGGTTTADRSLCNQSATYISGASYKFSIWLRSRGSSVSMGIGADGIIGNQPITVTSEWTQFSFTAAATAGSGTVWFQLRGGQSPAHSNSADLEVWGASLVPANLASLPYQRVNTATDYDSDASKFPTFLRCDGTNDGMQTNAIDFTGTDKMFVGVGVRKLSDAAIACVLETSGGGSANSMSVFAPIAAASPDYFFRTYGATGNASLRATTYTSPTTNVLSCSFNNASTSVNTAVLPRINGAIPSTTVVFDTNTVGNYGNYPLYLFRRGGSSLPFNGWFYGCLIKGATLSASQIALAERWLAEKTKTVTLA